MIRRRFTWDVPTACGMLRVVFAPSRSTIHRVAMSPCGGKRPWWNGLQVLLPGPFQAGQRVRASVSFSGESLGEHTLRCLDSGTRSIFGLEPDEWKRVYNYRRDRADVHAREGDLGWRCLFDFDRWTNEYLIDSTELDPDVREARKIVVRRLAGALWSRVGYRYGVGSREEVNKDDFDVCSSALVDAMRPLTSCGWGRVAALFEDFAAGVLRERAPIQAEGEEEQLWPVNEPDSAFVFLFAEFAIAGTEVAPQEAWCRELLPAFVKMQKYYIARFGESKQEYLSEYSVAPATLGCRERAAIDWSFRAPRSPTEVDEMINQNLKDAAPKFENPRSR